MKRGVNINHLGYTIEVVKFVQSFHNGFFDFFFNFISFLGEEYVFIIILGFIYWTYNKVLGELLGLSLAFSLVINNSLKQLFSALRPFEEFPNEVTNLRPETSTGHSFPSGHTQNFSTFLSSGSFFFKKYRVFIINIILVVLMGLSRIYLGVHYLEDVLTAAVLGLLIAFIFYKVFTKYYSNTLILHRIYLISIIVFLPIVFILGSSGLFKGYGILVGFVFAVIFEKKYVKFSTDIIFYKKLLRLILGLIIVLSLQIGLKYIYSPFIDEGTYLFDVLSSIRYFLIAFLGFGIYPYIFKKYNF